MKSSFLFLISLISYCTSIFPQNYKVIESTADFIKIEFNFENEFAIQDVTVDGNKFQIIKGAEDYFNKSGTPGLPSVPINIGIPFKTNPSIKILSIEQKKIPSVFLLPFPDSSNQPLNSLSFSEQIYNSNSYFPQSSAEIAETFISRLTKVAGLIVYPYQFNPVSRDLIFNKRIVLQIDYKSDQNDPRGFVKMSDPITQEIIKSNLINPTEASNFSGKLVGEKSSLSKREEYWFDPQKNYFKIYLNKKGVYRITHDYLVNAGVPVSDLALEKFELFNEGNKIPIDVVDLDSNGVFNSGDYFQFVGGPPSPTAYCTSNIYNLTNVYWFSYQNNSTVSRYEYKNGFPQTWENTYQSNLKTLHYEEDMIHEKLGYAYDDRRDFWFWGRASAESGNNIQSFTTNFSSFPNFILDSNRVKFRINMHGLTTTTSAQCVSNHKANISLTDQPIGAALWRDQNTYTFESSFYVSEDSIKIYPTGNILKVTVNGDACAATSSDEIRINWFEFDYWRENRTLGNNFDFKSTTPYLGVNRFWLFNWQRANMKIYIPQKGQLISNPQFVNDGYGSVLFVDTVTSNTEYFCVSNDFYLTPDSITADEIADLRNTANGADYIIITHPNFMSAAQKLADYRSSSLANYVSPRVKIVNIYEIYDEFSFGLLDPTSLNSFVKYAYDNWQAPIPYYITIVGDMSSDYRGKISTSKKNFVPSMQYFARTFGQVPSDNLIVNVVGSDLYPDLTVGRISCETITEANTIVDKIINYPADNSKTWKENVVLLASGLSESDQIRFGFNDSSKALERDLLIPYGYTAAKVFNYPDPSYPEDFQFKGAGPEMREELNNGAAVANYYGHGGGGQWDLIFTNDDIYELHNKSKLPLVLSVTCYTAQFDNQDCFGEVFIRAQDKGAIGFLGSVGLTYWNAGTILNRKLYQQIFANKQYVIGNAILIAKSNVGGFNDMISQLTYLGDPALELTLPKYPDFEIKSSDITISPENPSKNDTVIININIKNFGIMFSDSATVEVYNNSIDAANLIGQTKLSGFGQKSAAKISWIPNEAGLYSLIVRINETNPIMEIDHSDNLATASFAVYDLDEPSIVKPIDGFSTSSSSIEFLLTDVSEIIGKELNYFFEIDTSINFSNPLIVSSGINPIKGLVNWKPTLPLSNGEFFWRVRISDGTNFSSWSKMRSFSVTANPKNGYSAFGNILRTFETNNLVYSENEKSLKLNIELLPPKPSNYTFIEDISPKTSITDSVGLTTITTDGTYLYFANIWYYAQNFNSGGKSFIYKIGSGNNGTVKGEFYGTVPNFFDRIAFQMFYHSDGNIYVATGSPYYLKRINPNTGDTSAVFIPKGMLDSESGKIQNGSFYITSDGNFIYNLALTDSLGGNKYMLRVFNPDDNWDLARPDVQLNSTKYQGFSGFFAADGFVYPNENLISGYMRRIQAENGVFYEEWITYSPFKSYYAWCWDWQNNKVYGSVFRTGFSPKISVFEGRYQNAEGSILTSEIGPALNWNEANYEISTIGSAGTYKCLLLGYNNNSIRWDTLNSSMPPQYSLSSIDGSIYKKLKLKFELRDTSFGDTSPLKFNSLNVTYLPLPEIVLSKGNLIFQPDSILQGFPVELSLKTLNVGFANADSVALDFYLDNADFPIFQSGGKIAADSSDEAKFIIETSRLTPHAYHNIKAISKLISSDEYFIYNNIVDKNFYVLRDSTNPVFTITVDGKQIVDGDVISAKPEILISLKDDSPLPLDTTLFTIIYNNVPLTFSRSDVQFTYTPYPSSEAQIKWNPELKDGRHTLEILAKDASGNFFDTTSYRTVFYVYNQPDLLNVYNYPNPFKNDTYFTFELRGTNVPDDFKLKIYTVAGRLIKEISIPPAELNIGFNLVYWDGRDADGDEVGNGVYFYKIISKLEDETKVITQKLAKIR